MLRRLPCVLILVTLSAPAAWSQEAPGSTFFEIPLPTMAFTGELATVFLAGPPADETILNTTWQVTFSSPPNGTIASDFALDLGLWIGNQKVYMHVTGADFGFPSATGTYTGTLASDEFNGLLQMGGTSPTAADLHVYSVGGGLTGQFVESRVTLEFAGDCQTDLGFGGPGDMSISLCGESLQTGGSGQLSLDGALPSATVFLALGFGNNPTSFKGGTLVPVPFELLLPVQADGAGHLELLVPGGGGPLTVFAQAASADPSQPFGYALSNALQIELGP